MSYCRIPLSQNKTALVDSSDYHKVVKHKWYAIKGHSGIWYAQAHQGNTTIYMHRLLMGFPPCDVDHRNRNGLDNRRGNMRWATRSLNNGNRGRTKANTSGFKGAFRKRKRWFAKIAFHGEQIYLGTFDTPRQAGDAYAAAAQLIFMEFARV